MSHGRGQAIRAVCWLLVLATAAGCRGGGGGGAGTALIDDLSRALGEASDLGDLGAVVRQDVAVARTGQRLGSLLDDVPANPPSELSALADKARRAQEAIVQVDDAMRHAGTAAASLPRAGDEAATAAVSEVIWDSQSLRALWDRLADHGSDIARDVACDLSWGELKPEEQDLINAAIDEGSVTVSYTEEVATATADAIDDAAHRAVAADFGEQVAGVVGWAQYGSGILEKVHDLLGPDLDREIVAPDFTRTRALYFWARVCLAPPG
jgi:hypothetical protein